QRAIAESGLDVSCYLGEIPVGARLPWDHLDMLLAEGFLEKEHLRATRHKASPPCGKAFWDPVHHTNLLDAVSAFSRKLVCYDCGVACDLGHVKEERVDFLKLLGAKARPEPRPAAAPKVGRHDAPPKFDQPEALWYRLAFTKLGRSALTGHLDLVRNL